MVAGSLTYNTKMDTKGIESGINSVKKVAKIGFAAVAASVTAVSVALGKIVKDSVTARGELEQQVGGIQTLFKESADEVIKNANIAYKTAGLSAIDYMQTATSFSASLLQSLKGNTQKASEYTDRAIRDMSDNANKMGTSMEMIQNAYQGFAKQNYTMLDNLKLGYGGTKTEMERLIDDASKMKDIQKELNLTVDEGDLSFGNIVNAISVMQQSLEITGTTAKEADETLQGSLSSMKASWNNFLSGSGDLGQVVETAQNVTRSVLRIVKDAIPDIINSVTDYLPQFLKLGEDILEQIIEGIKLYLPNIVQSTGEIINALLHEVTNLAPQTVQISTQVIETLVNGIVSNLPQLVKTGMQTTTELIKGIAKMLPKLVPTIVECITTIVDTLIDNIDLLVDAGIELIIALAEGLIDALPRLIEKIPEIMEKLSYAIIRNLPKIVLAGIEITKKLAQGLINGIGKLGESASKLIETIWNYVKELPNKMIEVGKNSIDGIITWFKELPNKLGEIIGEAIGSVIKFGIELAKWIKNELPNIINGIVEWFKQLPSKIWNWLVETIINIGKWIIDMKQKCDEGFKNIVDGIINWFKELPEKMLEIGKNIVSGIWNGIVSAKDGMMNNIKGFANGITDGIKGVLGIHSPSRVMRDMVGKFIPQGIAEGIDKNSKSIDQAVDKMNKNLINKMKNAVNVETGKINANAVVRSNANYNSVIQLNANFEGNMTMDNTKVGRIVAPAVARTIKAGGLA